MPLLYTDEVPFFSVPYADLVELVVTRKRRPSWPAPHEGREIKDEIWQLAEQCWIEDPDTRPTATQAHDNITYAIYRLPPQAATYTPANSTKLYVTELGLDWISELDTELAQAVFSVDYLDSLITQERWDLGTDGSRRLARKQGDIVLSRVATLGTGHPRTLVALSDLATTYFHLGMFEAAKKVQIQVVAGRTEMLGADHQDTLTSMSNLAASYRKLEQLQDALALGLAVVQHQKTLLGEHHLETLKASYDLGLTYYQLKRYTEARKLHYKVFQLRERMLGTGHPDTLVAMQSLAETYTQLDNHVRALDLMYLVVSQSKRVFGKDHQYTMAAKDRQKRIEHLSVGQGHLGNLRIYAGRGLYRLGKYTDTLEPL
ncbi:hypothetical protein C8R46DRAFT_1187978 [Mycena filopes]|nr:hypothetical protein C8R46DRAFT_1187978 [Mycena filopes]